jgi:hypothetical protein
MAAFVRGIVNSGLVPTSELTAMQSETSAIARWKESWLAELVCLLLAAPLSFVKPPTDLAVGTTVYHPNPVTGGMTLSGGWYWVVCLLLFRFLMFRWLWHLGLWCYFLWRVSKLQLHLVPTNPDGVAGLGSLELVHSQFAPLIMAFSAVGAASFAEQISAGTMTINAMYPQLVVLLIVYAALFLGPLLIFTLKLNNCRSKGLTDYGAVAARYVNEFERKWVGADGAREPDLLGSADLQSLADLSNSVSVVRNMRMAPISRRILMALAIPALLPMLPLVLFVFPIGTLAENLVCSRSERNIMGARQHAISTLVVSSTAAYRSSWHISFGQVALEEEIEERTDGGNRGQPPDIFPARSNRRLDDVGGKLKGQAANQPARVT